VNTGALECKQFLFYPFGTRSVTGVKNQVIGRKQGKEIWIFAYDK